MSDDLAARFAKGAPIESAGGDDLAARFGRGVAVTTPEKTGFWEAAAKGGGQGITLGFGDEINGAIQAGLAKLQGEDGSLGDLYRRNRDTFRQEDATAEADQGAAFNIGNVAGGLALAPLGGSTAAAKLAGYAPRLARAVNLLRPGGGALSQIVKAGAGLGAATGLGASESDSLGGMARDTVVGGAVGAGAGLAGHLGQQAIEGTGRLLGRAGNKLLGRAEAKAAQMGEAKALEEVLSGSQRSATANADLNRQAERIRTGGISLTPEQEAAVKAAEVYSAQKGLEKLPESVAKSESTAAALKELLANKTARAASVTEEALKSSGKADARSFLKSYGEPLAMAYAGGKIGEQFDAPWMGGAAGLIFGRTRAGKALLSRVARPGNQRALAGALKSLGSGLGRMAPGAATAESALGRNSGLVGAAQSGLMNIPAVAELFDDDQRNAIVQALLEREGR